MKEMKGLNFSLMIITCIYQAFNIANIDGIFNNDLEIIFEWLKRRLKLLKQKIFF